MRKFFCFCILVVMIFSVCFALEDDAGYYEEEALGEELDDYNYDGSSSSGISQSELKEYYREYLAYEREQEAKNDKGPVIKAKIVDVGDKDTVYGLDYYTPYKVSYQPIKVRILEGEHEGEVFDVKYILTADTYENVKVTEAKLGDTVFVRISNDESGKAEAYTTSYDARVYRIPAIIILSVAVVILIVVCFKVDGFKFVLLALLIFDLVFVITLPQIVKDKEWVTLESSDYGFPTKEVIEADESISILDVDAVGNPTKVEMARGSNNTLILAIIDALVIATVCLINNIGLGKKTVLAFVITTCALIFACVFASGVNIITGMNGNSYEAISVTESLLNKDIDFNALYMLTVLVISSVVISNCVSKVINSIDSENYKQDIREFVQREFGVVVAISLVLLMPKVMTLIVFNYSVKEVLNSEMALVEIVRMFTVIISSVLAMLVTQKVCKKAEKPEVQEEVQVEEQA